MVDFGDMVETILSPPLRELAGIADGLEDAGGRSSDKDLGNNKHSGSGVIVAVAIYYAPRISRFVEISGE